MLLTILLLQLQYVSSRAGSPAELVALVARVSKLLCATYYLTAVVAVSKL